MAVRDTLIGSLFDGRYRIQRKLGAGGMANVYLAEDQELGRRVAIKILNERHANDDQFVERFRREAQNAAALAHPNIVSIYDRGEAEGTYYIAMEYLDGRSLKELILSRGPAPVSVAIDYARQILSALRFAHRNGIVHRDIKPHNVLVDPEGRVKVTDFGIARAGASQMTEAGSIVGTAQYLSPEQAKGTAVDQRSDIYSVGVVLYELLTGTVPFTGDTPVEIAMKHISAVPDPPSKKRPDIPHDVDLVVMRALAKDPHDRYQSAEEMEADLDRLVRGVAVSRATEESATQIMRPAGAETAATMVAPPRRPPASGLRPPVTPPVYYDYEEPIHRRPFWPWLLALLFVIGAGVGAYFLYGQISSQLNSNKSISVDYYIGLRQPDAVAKIHAAGLKDRITTQSSDTQPEGFVLDQNPIAGARVDKGSTVHLTVSSGKPKSTVPDVVGEQSTDAVAALTEAHLKVDPHQINSDKPQGQVIAQDPPGGTQVVQGTKVRINVSSGPKPIGVPPVIGQSFESANSELQAAGFKVSRQDVESNEPKDTVVDQSPGANSFAAKGTTVTLKVSKGPSTSSVPDVTSEDESQATSDLKASGFNVHVVRQDTNDPTQDGIVLTQSPQGGQQAKPGTTVTITVGRFVQLTTTTTTTTP